MMNKMRLSLFVLLMSTGVLLAQNAKIILQIDPYGDPSKPVIAEPSKTIHFDAKAYQATSTGRGQLVTIDNLDWTVDPVTFGTISPNGDFVINAIAPANAPLIGRVVAHAAVGGITLEASVYVALLQTPINPKLDYTFSGIVKDESGNPIVGAVILAQSDKPQMSYGFTERTGADGKYSIKVPAGKYVFSASAPGFVTEFYDNVYTIVNATAVETDVNNKVKDGINFTLGTGGSISGKVVAAADNSPVGGALIGIAINASSNPIGQIKIGVNTNASGEYTLTGLTPGKYYVQANAQGFQIQFYNKVADIKSATLVEVIDKSTTSNIDFALEKGGIDPRNPYTISGIVLDESNNPIAGAVVSAEDVIRMQPGNINFAAKTDVDGKYTITVPAGSYIVSANAPQFMQKFFDGVSTRDKATSLTLNTTTPKQENINFILGQGGKITGKVLKASDGTAIQNAFVSILVDPSKPPYPTNPNGTVGVPTNDKGEYTISGLITNTYIVVAHKDGYEDQYYNKVDKPDQATKVDVTEGQTTANINFELVAMAGISGKVTDKDNGNPVPKTQIMIDGGPVNSRPFMAFTDANGEYNLPVPAGTYKVHAFAPMYSNQWYDGQSDPKNANDVVVVKGVNTPNINFALEHWGGSIAGTVKDDAGTPIEKAIVKVWGNMITSTPIGKRFFASAMTDVDGKYEVKGLPAGGYIVAASAKGFMLEFYNNVPDVKNATEVTVVNKQATTGIDFSLSKGGSISGKVIDVKTNAVIPNAFVSVRSAMALSEMGAVTDQNGEYTIGGLPSGDYVVFAVAKGYKGKFYNDVYDPVLATNVTVTIPNTTSGIDFSLELGPPIKHRITGSIVDAVTRQPLRLTFVESIDPTNGQTITTTTDEQGQFEIDGGANSILRARAIGYIGSYAGGKTNWAEGKVPVNGGSAMFELAPISETGFAAIRGTVTEDGTNKPISNAWIYGTDVDGETFFACSNIRGEFAITGTTNGSLDLMLSGVQYEQATGKSDVKDLNNSTSMTSRKVNNTLRANDPVSNPKFELGQNYPNPFNPSTMITFSIPTATRVTLKIYNLLGQEVTTLVNSTKEAGSHNVIWNAEKMQSGTYIYRLEANGSISTRKMTLLK